MRASSNKDSRVPTGAVWFALLAAPIAWAIQLTAAWLIVDSACARMEPGVAADTSSVRWATAAVSLVAVLIAAGGLFTAVRLFRRIGASFLPITGESRQGFLLALGILISGVFLLGTFLAAWPLVTLPVCEAMR